MALVQTSSHWRRRVRGFCRVAVYCACLGAAFLVAKAHSAYAAVRESSLQMGRDLWQLRDVLGDATQLSLNGAHFLVSHRHLHSDPKTLLDRIEHHCAEYGWKVDAPVSTAVRAARGPEQWAAPRLGVLRSGAEQEGAVACLVSPEGENDRHSLLRRVLRAKATHDLGVLGEVRYVFVKQAEIPGDSEVISVASVGAFDPTKLIAIGDAPGEDLQGVPRPAHSRRILSAAVVGEEYGLHSYTTPGVPSAALRAYEASLRALGWQSLDDSPFKPVATVPPALSGTFLKDGAALLVMASGNKQGARVDLVQIGARGAVFSQK